MLWGTAQLFKDRRYMHGAATSCNASVFAHAAAQVKSAIDATVLLGGENYVLWGGREGYSTLLNTDYPHEQAALAAFLRAVADYARKAGLKGHLLLEPKPHEPSKHQCESRSRSARAVSFCRRGRLPGGAISRDGRARACPVVERAPPPPRNGEDDRTSTDDDTPTYNRPNNKTTTTTTQTPPPPKKKDDYDVGTTLAFLRKHGLERDYALNIECNHATLSGHSCEHEVVTASADGAWASFDANTGDPQLGWDTDEFLTDPVEATRVMLALLRQGGWPAAAGRGRGGRGGINFDAKLRRESVSPADLVLAHVAGVDALARGLRSAARLLADGALDALVADRYASWRSPLGQRILSGKASLVELEKWALDGANAEAAEDVRSGRQELAEMLLTRAIV